MPRLISKTCARDSAYLMARSTFEFGSHHCRLAHLAQLSGSGASGLTEDLLEGLRSKMRMQQSP
jgi:hypothetical protein